MKKRFTHIIFTFLLSICMLSSLLASETALKEELSTPLTNIEFEVRLTAPRRFAVLFENTEGNPIPVKVFDMVGNQVGQDVSMQKGRFTKEFDMTNSRSEVFIVEVGNSRNNNTKRVFLKN